MRYATAAAFRQALDDRLNAEAPKAGPGLARLRKRVASELFLRRLVAVAPDRWVLKGALALDFRLPGTTRATRDIDLGRTDDEEAATKDIGAAQQLALDDYFTFAAERTDALADTDDFHAIRFHVTAELGGRIFEKFVVDIGFAEAATWTPDVVVTSDFLSFAGIDPVRIPALPLAQHVAEKVHAYTRRYGELQRESTRPKDLVDILLIARTEALDAASVRSALEATFQQRGQQALPTSLPPPPAAWAGPFARLASQVDLQPELGAAFVAAAGFLDPILAGLAEGTWSPGQRTWA